MPFSRARGKLGINILKFQAWCFIDFWPLIMCRQSYHWHLHVCPRTTQRQCQFCHLTLFSNWPFFDLWPFIRRSEKEVTMDTFASWSKTTHWPFYFCHLTHFVTWPFFDLWPFNRRSDKEVTVDTYACFLNTNTLSLLLGRWLQTNFS